MSRGDLSLTKSKQFVSIKKCLSQVLQWNRNPPGELQLGPGQLKNLKLFFPSSMMGANTTTWSVRAIELWKASTLKDRNFASTTTYLTQSLQSSSGAAQLPTDPPSLTSQSTSTQFQAFQHQTWWAPQGPRIVCNYHFVIIILFRILDI